MKAVSSGAAEFGDVDLIVAAKEALDKMLLLLDGAAGIFVHPGNLDDPSIGAATDILNKGMESTLTESISAKCVAFSRVSEAVPVLNYVLNWLGYPSGTEGQWVAPNGFIDTLQAACDKMGKRRYVVPLMLLVVTLQGIGESEVRMDMRERWKVIVQNLQANSEYAWIYQDAILQVASVALAKAFPVNDVSSVCLSLDKKVAIDEFCMAARKFIAGLTVISHPVFPENCDESSR